MKAGGGRRPGGGTRGRHSRLTGLGFCLLSLIAFALMVHAKEFRQESAPRPDGFRSSDGGTLTFTDARRQAAEFIASHRAIILTPEQKKVMDEALSSIPAPCCDAYSIATCCCPCNLAKSTWGLSKLLIAKHQFDAAQVRAAAVDWLQFTNLGGYSGNACFRGGCNRPFEQDGCGGMDEKELRKQ